MKKPQTSTSPVGSQPVVTDGERRIPIRSLWWLMLYAAADQEHLGIDLFAVEESPDDLPDLVAKVLVRLSKERLRRDLSPGYVQRADTLHRVRGRIDVVGTAAGRLPDRGQVLCRFDEMTWDRPRYRFVRDTLERLASIVNSPELKHECRSTAARFRNVGVLGPPPTARSMRGETFGRHDAADRPIVSAAILAREMWIPTEQVGRDSLPVAPSDEPWLRTLFERAMLGFYRVNLDDAEWLVLGPKRHDWQISDQSGGMKDLLPSMLTDIELVHRPTSHHYIIDTKFNDPLVDTRHRSRSLRSAYIYQIYAYLRSQERAEDPSSLNSAGILLHPAVGESVSAWAEIQGHRMAVETVDLSGEPRETKRQLLGVVGIA